MNEVARGQMLMPSSHEATQRNLRATEQQQMANLGVEDESDSDQGYEDVVIHAQIRGLSYGVQWCHFEQTNHDNALQKALHISGKPEVNEYYIGVAKLPALRFYEPPSPHCEQFKAMYVLAVGTNICHHERRTIEACRHAKPRGLRNRSNGGEGIHRLSVRFLYICINPALSGSHYT